MAREIDILVRAAGKECAIVDKESHVLWSQDELLQAQQIGCFRDEDSLAPPSEKTAVTSPYPGCVQQQSRTARFDGYRLVGQTEHFLVFAPPCGDLDGKNWY
jgi:hypothetical protein